MAQDTFPAFGLGLGGFSRIPYLVLFSFSSRRSSPARELGSVSIELAMHTGAQVRLALVLIFCFSVDTFSPSPLAGGMAMVSVDDLFLSLATRPSVISFLFGVLCRLCNLAVQRRGSGF